jgi:hypothetical protein
MSRKRLGGDGLSWRSRNKRFVWRRLDFLRQFPDGGQEFILQKIPVWRRLCELGFSAPELVRLRAGRVYTRQRWVIGQTHTPNVEELRAAIRQLQLVHQEGILHGDISPDHLLAGDEQLAWIDWINATTPGAIHFRGKKGFASAELQTFGVMSESSEIYALGKAMLAWNHPSPDLRKIALRAAHCDPRYRYPNLVWLLKDLDVIAEAKRGE